MVEKWQDGEVEGAGERQEAEWGGEERQEADAGLEAFEG
jgi:hypothetical protein